MPPQFPASGGAGNAGQAPGGGYDPTKASTGGGTFTGTESDLYGVTDAIAVQQVGTRRKRKSFMGNDLTFGVVKPTLQKDTILNLLKKLAGLGAEDLSALQMSLLRAGYYPKSLKADDLPLGSADDLTMNAYTALLIDTARANMAGQDVTWEDILADRERLHGDDLLNGGNASPFPISDTQGLLATVQEIAKAKRGKPLAPKTAELFASIIQQMQTGAGTATSGAVSQPDVQARAEAFVLQQDPKGVASYTAADYMDAAIQTLGLGG